MRHIRKGREPRKLTNFKNKNRNRPELLCYDALTGEIKLVLRDRMLREQGALCAYTMVAIGREEAVDFHIEHVRPQRGGTANELDYRNMVLCAPGKPAMSDCEWGAVRKGGAIVDESNFISPLTEGCERRLKYGVGGDVRPSSDNDAAAQGTIDLLALNHRDLTDARTKALRDQGLGTRTSKPITAAQAERLAQEIIKPDQGGHLQPFCIAIKQVAERFARQSRSRAARLSKSHGA